MGGIYNIKCFHNHFGSWTNALQKVGLKPAYPKLSEDKLLFDELQRIIKKLGKNPFPREIEKIGKYPSIYYVKRFGSIKKSLSALADRFETASL